MTENLTPVSDVPPQNWLAADPAPLPTASPPAAPAPRFSVYALLALIAGIFMALAGVALGILLVVFPNANGDATIFLPSIIMAVGLLGVPLAWFGFWRLLGHSVQLQTNTWWVVAASIIVVALLGIGQLFATYDILPALTLGFIQPLIFVVASAGLVALTVGNWKGITQLRAWGSLTSGAWFSVLLSLIAEGMLVLMLAMMGIIILMVFAPDDGTRIIALAQNPDNLSIEAFYDFALRPWAIGGVLLTAAFLIPLLEELLKPLGVIMILGRRPTPMAAFVGGLLGGIGFAFTESLSNLMMINDPWFVLVAARLGTLVMHGFASALVGWGWGQLAAKKPLGLVMAYAGAVAIHGLWNGMVVAIVFSGLYIEQNAETNAGLSTVLGLLAGLGGIIIVCLVPACIIGLIWLGYRLRSAEASQ